MSDCYTLCGSTVSLAAALWGVSYVIAGIVFGLPQLKTTDSRDFRANDLLFGAMSVGALCFASMVLSLLGLYPRNILAEHPFGLQVVRAVIVGICLLPILVLGSEGSFLKWALRFVNFQQAKALSGIAYRLYIVSLVVALAMAISMAADIIYLFIDTAKDSAAAIAQKPITLTWYVGVLLILASSLATGGLVGIAATFLRQPAVPGESAPDFPSVVTKVKFIRMLSALLATLAILYYVPTLFASPYWYWQSLDWFCFLIGLAAIRVTWSLASPTTIDGRLASAAIVLMIGTTVINNPMLKFGFGSALWTTLDRGSSGVLAIMAVFLAVSARRLAGGVLA